MCSVKELKHNEHIRYYSLCMKFKNGQDLSIVVEGNTAVAWGDSDRTGARGNFSGVTNAPDLNLGNGYMSVKICYKIHPAVCIRHVYSVYRTDTSVSAIMK